MVLVAHNKNIQRIIDKIKSDTTLYDDGITAEKLRAVNFGDPANMVPQAEKKLPYCYVTTPSSLQTTTHDKGVANANNILPVSIEYKIVVIAHSHSKTEKSQKILYDIIKNIHTMAESDPLFSNGDGEDAIFTRSIISDVSWDEKTRGQLLTAVTITILASIGAFYYITIPGITTQIPIISKPVSREYVGYAPHLSVSGELDGYAATTESKTRYYEIEDSINLRNTLNDIKNSKEEISYDVNGETIIGYLSAVNQSYNFDGLPTLTLQFNVL